MGDVSAIDENSHKILQQQQQPINISKIHNVSNLRRIDENLLNKLFTSLPNEVVENLMRKQLPRPNNKRQSLAVTNNVEINNRIKDVVLDLRLLDEQSFDRRAELFLGYCRYLNYTYNTTLKYFNTLKATGLFGQGETLTNIRPDRLAFADSGRPHIRIVRMVDFKTLVAYLNNNFSKYTAPILMAVYTGLRSSELLQINTYALFQLKSRLTTVAIKRKHTVITSLEKHTTYWTPIYNTFLNKFIDDLTDLYADQYEAFLKRNINTLLFNITTRTLANRIRSLYVQAVGARAPHGFGIHSCRNMVAMLMAENSNNLVAISEFLQHRSMKFTRRYIKADFTHVTNQFNHLTDYELTSVRAKLNKIAPAAEEPTTTTKKKTTPQQPRRKPKT